MSDLTQAETDSINKTATAATEQAANLRATASRLRATADALAAGFVGQAGNANQEALGMAIQGVTNGSTALDGLSTSLVDTNKGYHAVEESGASALKQSNEALSGIADALRAGAR